MPVNFTDRLSQINRNQNISKNIFYHLVETEDINISVQGFQSQLSLGVPSTGENIKYVIDDPYNLDSAFGASLGADGLYVLNGTTLGTGDIVKSSDFDTRDFDGITFTLHYDASNMGELVSSSTGLKGTIIFNASDSDYYGFNGTTWNKILQGDDQYIKSISEGGGVLSVVSGNGFSQNISLSTTSPGVEVGLSGGSQVLAGNIVFNGATGIDISRTVDGATSSFDFSMGGGLSFGVSGDIVLIVAGATPGVSPSLNQEMVILGGDNINTFVQSYGPGGAECTINMSPNVDISGSLTADTAIHTGSLFATNDGHLGGLSLENKGITFPDGTYQDTVESSGLAKFNYTVTSGPTNYPSASSNGDFIYNPEVSISLGNNLSIFKNDRNAGDYRTVMSNLDPGSNFTVVFSVLNSNIKHYLYCRNANYSASPGKLDAEVYDTFPNSVTGGNGKIVSLEIIPTQDVVSAGGEFRLPGGETFDNLVTTLNGLSGDVTINAGTNVTLTTGASGITIDSSIVANAGLTLNGPTLDIDSTQVIHVAGISADGGITLGSFISIPDTFDIVNDDNNSLFEVSNGRNVRIGDVDSFGNGNNILIRDSHDQINITANTVGLAAENVNIQQKLRHTNDTNTHLAFPANDEIALTTGGVTLAHLTDTFALQKGLSLDAAGITFPDGTYQSTAAGTITDSYTGHIEVVANKDYYLDPRVPIERTVTEFFVVASVAGGTAELKGTNGSISTVAIGTSGVTGSLANTTLPVGGTLELGVTGGEAAEDLRFAVRYTQ